MLSKLVSQTNAHFTLLTKPFFQAISECERSIQNSNLLYIFNFSLAAMGDTMGDRQHQSSVTFTLKPGN